MLYAGAAMVAPASLPPSVWLQHAKKKEGKKERKIKKEIRKRGLEERKWVMSQEDQFPPIESTYHKPLTHSPTSWESVRVSGENPQKFGRPHRVSLVTAKKKSQITPAIQKKSK